MKTRFYVVISLLSALVPAGCAQVSGPPVDPAAGIPVFVDGFDVLAEGRLVPNNAVRLAFPIGGQVTEILVAAGDEVAAGDILARLGDREQFAAAVAAAELELAMSTLEKSTVEAELLAARNALGEIEDSWPQQVILAQQALLDARQRQFEADLDLAALTSSAGDFEISQAETELAIAGAQLAQAEARFAELVEGPDPDAVALAEAQITATEDRIAAVDQRILTAQANLAAAVARQGDLDLVAPIAGTIVELDLIAGEQVVPGDPVVHIADFSSWHVETDNLTEIEVVDVSPGQTVTVVPDALPDIVLTGTVEDIAYVFEEKGGEITYTADLRLNEMDPRLRWGMTVVVTFEK
jgi:multidrug resistance efflux pump